MSRGAWGLVFVIVGILIALFAALADPIGIGDDTDFSYLQMIGILVGIAITLVGAALMIREEPSP